jgi:hypothetical protein
MSSAPEQNAPNESSVKLKAPDNNSSPIDLSKLSTQDFSAVLRRIFAGTPAATSAKYLSIVAAIIFASFGFGMFVRDVLPPKEPPSTKAHGGEGLEISANEIIRNKNQEIDELKIKTRQLEEQIKRKPSYNTCNVYGSDLGTLRRKKEEIEKYIQLLLNPPPPQDYSTTGIYYSIDQLRIWKEVAIEHRKTASDIQQQILTIEQNRKDCE